LVAEPVSASDKSNYHTGRTQFTQSCVVVACLTQNLVGMLADVRRTPRRHLACAFDKKGTVDRKKSAVFERYENLVDEHLLVAIDFRDLGHHVEDEAMGRKYVIPMGKVMRRERLV